MKYIEGREIQEIAVMDNDANVQTMSLVETADGNIFSVHASYLEQEIDELRSPYNDCYIAFKTGNVGDNWKNAAGESIAISDIVAIF